MPRIGTDGDRGVRVVLGGSVLGSEKFLEVRTIPEELVDVVVHDALVDGVLLLLDDLVLQEGVDGRDDRVQVVVRRVGHRGRLDWLELEPIPIPHRAPASTSGHISLRAPSLGLAHVGSGARSGADTGRRSTHGDRLERECIRGAVEEEAEELGQMAKVGSLAVDEEEQDHPMQLTGADPLLFLLDGHKLPRAQECPRAALRQRAETLVHLLALALGPSKLGESHVAHPTAVVVQQLLVGGRDRVRSEAISRGNQEAINETHRLVEGRECVQSEAISR